MQSFLMALANQRSQGHSRRAAYAEMVACMMADSRRSQARRSRDWLLVSFRCPCPAVRLSPELKAIIGVESSADVVRYAELGRHTRDHHPADAQEVLRALPKTAADLVFFGDALRQKGRFELYFRHTIDTYILVPIKFVPAGSRAPTDECWADSAWKIGSRKLNQRIRTKKLRRVRNQEGHDSRSTMA